MCTTCATAAEQARGTATQRGYTSTGHRRFRAQVLTRDPICQLCHKTWATIADHHPLTRRELIDLNRDPNDPTAGRGLCKPCHDRHTAATTPGGWNAR